jgi:hypothetical protein
VTATTTPAATRTGTANQIARRLARAVNLMVAESGPCPSRLPRRNLGVASEAPVT